jgi:uncharacterized protein YfcZ (UPF0381/DUF406 family)
MKETYANTCEMIVKMIIEEAKCEAEYDAAFDAFSEQNKAVAYLEERYKEEGEAVGSELDAAYDANHEAWEKQRNAYDKLDAIRGILEHLREAAKLIEEIEGM